MRKSITLTALLLAPVMATAAPAPSPSGTPGKAGPAKLEPVAGTKLIRVILTPKAAERLAIETAPAREEVVVRRRVAFGEVVPPPSRRITAAQPMDALVAAATEDRSAVWVRVRLSGDELKQVAQDQPVRVRPLARDAKAPGATAQPANGPSEPGILYYAVQPPAQGLEPGQRVRVELPLTGSSAPKKVVPYASVLYDAYGGAWTYTSPEPLVFVRHPISIDYIEGDVAVLSDGPPPGTAVVTVGAAELFGTEFKVGH